MLEERKREFRAVARQRRIATGHRAERSEVIVRCLEELEVVVAAERVLAYAPMGSEVDVTSFAAWCRGVGKQVCVPEDDVDPSWADVIIVPGLAFTPDGRRCGQGAGWYDRFLPGRRAGCVTIGVGFRTQLVDDVPTEPHDVVLDLVITD